MLHLLLEKICAEIEGVDLQDYYREHGGVLYGKSASLKKNPVGLENFRPFTIFLTLEEFIRGLVKSGLYYRDGKFKCSTISTQTLSQELSEGRYKDHFSVAETALRDPNWKALFVYIILKRLDKADTNPSVLHDEMEYQLSSHVIFKNNDFGKSLAEAHFRKN